MAAELRSVSSNRAMQRRPSPNPSSGFSSVSDGVGSSQNPNGAAMAVSSSALHALQAILEAANTLPCIKYITQVTITVLKVIEDIQMTNDAVRRVAMRAKDIVLAVAKACSHAPEEISAHLESDVRQLTETMDDILDFTREISSRSTVSKLVHRGDDAAAVKSLDSRLTHAFQLFELQSSVSIRIAQQQMTNQISGLTLQPPQIQAQTRPRLITSTPLHITEGLYIIRNAMNWRLAIETEHRRPAPNPCHTFMGTSNESEISLYQIWVISSRNGRKTDYTIRNFATGASLDVWRGETQDGTHVICFPSHDGQNQTWSIYGSQAGKTLDYCTIRCHGTRTVLDSRCPAGSNCDYVHMTSLKDTQAPGASQQWTLTRIPFTLNPTTSSAARATSPAAGLPRRRYVLENVASGSYATVRASNGNTPNVVMQNDFKLASTWHFEHTVHDDGRYDDMFALVTGTAPSGLATLDFYGARHVAANPGAYSPNNQYHMWKAVPAPTEGAFCFRHSATGRLLCQSSQKLVVDMAASTASDETCQWRIRDALTGDSCPILYDSSLTIPPPGFSGPLQFSAQSEDIPDVLMFRTGMATTTTCAVVSESLKREHAMIREMFNSGYSSLVLAPRLITAWKAGLGLYDIVIRDDEPALGPVVTFRGKSSFDACSPREHT